MGEMAPRGDVEFFLEGGVFSNGGTYYLRKRLGITC